MDWMVVTWANGQVGLGLVEAGHAWPEGDDAPASQRRGGSQRKVFDLVEEMDFWVVVEEIGGRIVEIGGVGGRWRWWELWCGVGGGELRDGGRIEWRRLQF